MQTAKITRAYRAVPPGEIYPRLFRPGDIVRGRVAEAALKAGHAETAEDAVAPVAAPPAEQGETTPPPPPPRKAKVIKQGEFEHDGKRARFAKGVAVDGKLAEAMVEAGLAEWSEPAAA